MESVKVTTLTPEQIASVNVGYWAILKQIRVQTGDFSFKDHEFQKEPIQSLSKRICYIKAAQCFGATEIEVLKDIHGMQYGRYKLGVAHLFPTDVEVQDFGKSRFNPLILRNKEAIGKYVKSGGKGTDNVSLKKINDAFLYLRGARQGQKIGETDEDTSSKTSSFPVDRVVFDEVDYMDSTVIEKYKQRMAHSPIKEEVYLGNPSHEDFGIDLIFKQSDQRYWWRKCLSCGTWTCAEKSFPSCVKIRSNGTGYIGCDKCGKELPAWQGEGTSEWRPDYPEKSNYMHGYHLSQLSTATNDPAEILADYTNPPNGNLGDIYRLRLGLPYSARDEKLRKSDILAMCGHDGIQVRHTGPCAMGVDVGKIKHVVIGIKTANDRYEILRAMKVETFGEIVDLAKRYNVQSDVVDIRPYEDEARAYQKASRHKTFLCEYSDSMLQDSIFNENTGTVKVHRTGIFDASHRLLSTGAIVLPRQCPELEEFARQCCNVAKFEEKDKKRGTITYRYRATGDRQEHFRNALNYFLLAASGHRIAKVSTYKTKRPEYANNQYQRV